MILIPLKKCNDSIAELWIDGQAYERCDIERCDCAIKIKRYRHEADFRIEVREPDNIFGEI